MNTNIQIGAQNFDQLSDNGAFTGSISAKLIKDTGSSYVILGHSENRASGESDHQVNKKIHSALSKNLIVDTLFLQKKYSQVCKKIH